jgi:hypothetical protein
VSLGYVSFVKYFIIAPNRSKYRSRVYFTCVWEFDFFCRFNHSFIIFYKKWIVENCLRFSFIIAAVLSGRTALILFVFLGLSTIFLYLKKIKFSKNINVGVYNYSFGNFIFSKFSSNFDVDIVKFITEQHLGKIKDGEEKNVQNKRDKY